MTSKQVVPLDKLQQLKIDFIADDPNPIINYHSSLHFFSGPLLVLNSKPKPATQHKPQSCRNFIILFMLQTLFLLPYSLQISEPTRWMPTNSAAKETQKWQLLNPYSLSCHCKIPFSTPAQLLQYVCSSPSSALAS